MGARALVGARVGRHPRVEQLPVLALVVRRQDVGELVVAAAARGAAAEAAAAAAATAAAAAELHRGLERAVERLEHLARPAVQLGRPLRVLEQHRRVELLMLSCRVCRGDLPSVVITTALVMLSAVSTSVELLVKSDARRRPGAARQPDRVRHDGSLLPDAR